MKRRINGGALRVLLAAACCLRLADAAVLRSGRAAEPVQAFEGAGSFVMKSFDHLRRSVVRIQSVSADFDWLQPFIPGTDGVSLGSGFVVQTEPYPLFVTNEHVVNDAKQVRLQLLLYGEQTWDAEVVSICPKFDIALLVLRNPEKFTKALAEANIKLEALPLSTKVAAMGENVVALGFPLGQDSLKVSKGNIAGNEEVDRNICIQSTAPVAPGSSGGPLLNEAGTEVVGVNFAKATNTDGVNYVIPAWRVTQQIKMHLAAQKPPAEGEKWKRIHVKVPGADLTTIEANQALFELSGGCQKGIYVARVGKRSPFLKATPAVPPKGFLVSMNGIELDRFGMGLSADYAADKVHFEDILRMVPDLGADVKFKMCAAGVETEHTMPMKYLEDYERGIRWVSEPYQEGWGRSYEMFGDVSVVQMTWNHVSAAYQGGNTGVVQWIQPDFITEPRVMVNYVRSGSYAWDVVSVGAAVDKVNNHTVRTMDEFRSHFLPEKQNKVWVLETATGQVVAVLFKDSLMKQISEGNEFGSSYLLTPGIVQAAADMGLIGGKQANSTIELSHPGKAPASQVAVAAAHNVTAPQPHHGHGKHHGNHGKHHGHHHDHHVGAKAKPIALLQGMQVTAAGPLLAHPSGWRLPEV